MTERPASLDDMRRAWPDKTDDELIAARVAIAEAGGTLTVVPSSEDYEVADSDDLDG